jgi:hypothetical protein
MLISLQSKACELSFSDVVSRAPATYLPTHHPQTLCPQRNHG